MIRLTLASDGSPVLINPAHITTVRPARGTGQSFVNVANGHGARVAATVAEIEALLAQPAGA